MNTPSVSPFSQVQPSPSTQGVARPLALSGWAGTDTVQFVESAASAAVWLKLNGSPAASTAFAPAAPGRPAGLMGGMPATVGAVAAGEPEADGQGAGAAEARWRRGARAGRWGRSAGTRGGGRLAPARRRGRAAGAGRG